MTTITAAKLTGAEILDLWHGYRGTDEEVDRVEIYTRRKNLQHLPTPTGSYMECNYHRGNIITERWVTFAHLAETARAELAHLGYVIAENPRTAPRVNVLGNPIS